MNFVDGKFIRVDESQGEEKLTQEAPAPNSSEFEEGVKIGAPGETCNQGGEMVIETEQDVNSSIENVNNMNGDLHGYTDGENSGDIETKNLGDKDGDSTDNNDKVVKWCVRAFCTIHHFITHHAVFLLLLHTKSEIEIVTITKLHKTIIL